jgi:hypothetical protein
MSTCQLKYRKAERSWYKTPKTWQKEQIIALEKDFPFPLHVSNINGFRHLILSNLKFI